MRSFFKNVSFSFSGSVIAGAVMFGVNIVSGRFLGPEEFGKIAFFLVIYQLFSILMLFGFDQSVLRSLSKTEDSIKHRNIVSTSIIFILLLSLFISIVLLFFHDTLAAILLTSSKLLVWSVVFALFASLRLLFDGIIRAAGLFKFQALIKVFESLIVIASLCLLVFLFGNKGFESYVIAIFVATVFVLVMFGLKLIGHYGWGKFDYNSLRKIFSYSKIVFFYSLISVFLAQGDKFLVNKYLGTYQLGIYNAYYISSILFMSVVMLSIYNVLFPMVSRQKDVSLAVRKIDKIALASFLPGLLIVSSIIFFMLKFFGNNYPIELNLIILFATLSLLQLFASFYAAVVNAHSNKSYFYSMLSLCLRSVLYILLVVVLIQRNTFSVNSILLLLIANSFVEIVFSKILIKKMAGITKAVE